MALSDQVMVKRQGFNHYRGRLRRHQPNAHQANNMIDPQRNKKVWVPAIQSWEKEFCYRVGLFTWENFLEAKQVSRIMAPKVLDWDDAARKEAFQNAKKRFHAQFHGQAVQPDSSLSPDLYIDHEINYDGREEDVELYRELDLIRNVEGSDVEEEEQVEYVPDYFHIAIQDIKPTGWDVEPEEFCGGRVLTGLIIGH